jgi:hypothetical protein
VSIDDLFFWGGENVLRADDDRISVLRQEIASYVDSYKPVPLDLSRRALDRITAIDCLRRVDIEVERRRLEKLAGMCM